MRIYFLINKTLNKKFRPYLNSSTLRNTIKFWKGNSSSVGLSNNFVQDQFDTFLNSKTKTTTIEESPELIDIISCIGKVQRARYLEYLKFL